MESLDNDMDAARPTDEAVGIESISHPSTTMGTGSQVRTRVLLVCEGTYPFHFGGVSTWAHQLIGLLPEVDFAMFSVVAEPWGAPHFDLPPNVVEFRAVPLWGVRDVAESDASVSPAESATRRARTSEAVVAAEFIPVFRAFLGTLFDDTPDLPRLGLQLQQLHRFFLRYDFDTAMRSLEVWTCFSAEARRHFPRAAADRGYRDVDFDLDDLTTALTYLQHWLFPIARALPRTEVVHAAMAGICSLVGSVAKLEHGAAFFLTEHGIYLRERYLAEASSTGSLFVKLFSLLFARRMTELSYMLADQISPCCDYNSRWELRNGATADRIQTLYYGVDSTVFTPAYKPIGEPPVVVWVARINPLKDVKTLLRAAGIVYQSRPDIQFRLFGSATAEDQRYYEECLALRSELRLDEAVIFAGHTSTPANAFNEGDLAVLSSISEGFPFTILEAMLCAKPVVATRVGGVPEQIAGCGIVVEPGNPEAMAAAILELMNDPIRLAEWGQVARQKAMHEFGLSKFAAVHLQSYLRLVDQRSDEPVSSLRSADRAGEDPVVGSGPPAGETGAVARTNLGEDWGDITIPLPLHVLVGGALCPVIAVQPASLMSPWRPRADTLPQLPHLGVTRVPAQLATLRLLEFPTREERQCSDPTNANRVLVRAPAAWDGGMGNARSPGAMMRGVAYSPSKQIEPGTNVVAFTGRPPRRSHTAELDGSAAWTPTDRETITVLTSDVLRRTPHPIDALEVAAVLESGGMRDESAVERYGAPDLFGLADAVFEHVRVTGLAARKTDDRGSPPRPSRREAFIDLAHGPLALFPGVVCLMITAAYGLLGGWRQHQVLALSLGLTSSMLVTGGFVHAIGRRGSLYLTVHHRAAFLHYLRAGMLVAGLGVVGLATTIYAITTALELFLPGDRLTFSLGFLGLSTIWLLSAGLSLTRASGWLGTGLAVGLMAGIAADRAVALALELLDMAADLHLGVGTLVGFAVAVFVVGHGLRRALTVEGKASPKLVVLPPAAYLLHESAPYFAFGFLSMVLLSVPHILGWFGAIGPDNERRTIIAVFEVGFTPALLPVVLAGGIIERTLRLFWQRMAVGQHSTPATALWQFGAALTTFYYEQRRCYLLALAVMSIVSYAAFGAALDGQWLAASPELLDPTTLRAICTLALLGCYFFGWGLFNCALVTTLARPTVALKAVVAGIGTTLLVGVPLSLGIQYTLALVAFVAGGGIFAAVSTVGVERLLDDADYHYFAAR